VKPPLSAQNRLISGRREVSRHRRESEQPGFFLRLFCFLFLSFFAFRALPEPALRLKRRVASENQKRLRCSVSGCRKMQSGLLSLFYPRKSACFGCKTGRKRPEISNSDGICCIFPPFLSKIAAVSRIS
jgi:hypothetical protein